MEHIRTTAEPRQRIPTFTDLLTFMMLVSSFCPQATDILNFTWDAFSLKTSTLK